MTLGNVVLSNILQPANVQWCVSTENAPLHKPLPLSVVERQRQTERERERERERDRQTDRERQTETESGQRFRKKITCQRTYRVISKGHSVCI